MSTQEDYSWIDFSTYQLRDTCQHDFCHRDNIGKQGQQQPNHVGLSNLELSNLGKPILGLPSSDYRESASGLMSSNGSESFTQPSMQSNESEGFTQASSQNRGSQPLIQTSSSPITSRNNPPLIVIHEVRLSQSYEAHNLTNIESTYMLPPRQNRGKPSDRYSLDGKVRYAIAKYVSTHRLSPKYQALVNKMDGIKIPTKVEEALGDP
ncbi:hypothetical protein ACFX1T_009130 [Malus domestica]